MKKYFFNLFCVSMLVISVAGIVSGCQQNIVSDGADSLSTSEIVFKAGGPVFEPNLKTKATVVTSLSSFYASFLRDNMANEAYWANVTFTGNNSEGYKSDKLYPVNYVNGNKRSGSFFASNVVHSHTLNNGISLNVSTDTDVIVSYAYHNEEPAPITLRFEHLLTRIGDVTVSAGDGYTISNVSIMITPKVSGTVNFKNVSSGITTTASQWSSVVTGADINIANSTPGTKSNDIWLLPGTYTFTASWRAVKGDYVENVSNKTCDVVLESGNVSSINTVLKGNANDVVFNVNITPWGAENKNVDFPTI